MGVKIPISRLLLICFGLLTFGNGYALELSPSSLEITAGKTAKISVADISGKVSAKSAKTAIASARYSTGSITVKGVKAGSTTVTVKDKKQSKQVAIKVLAAPVMAISSTSLAIGAGQTADIAVSNPQGKVSAKSSNAKLASVSYANGVATVKGIKTGKATITIKDGKTSKKASVTVSAATSALTISPSFVSVNVGASVSITISNASGEVKAETSDASIAKVSYGSGKAVITGIKAGKAEIKIKDSSTTKTAAVTVLGATASNSYTLLAWNDLGMHCMDGTDFSVFTILPPYNTLHAQLKDRNGKLVTQNVLLTYEAVKNSSGSINTSSADKTNFWLWVDELFGAVGLPNDVGLNLDGMGSGTPAPSNKTPSLKPAPMTYNAAYDWFEAEGIPVTPFDDAGNKDFYPTVKVVAKDAISGKVLASTTTVLPVSDEMTCKGCHASTDSTDPAQTAAKPAPDWLFDNDPEKDWKRNILALHDQKQASNNLFKSALTQAGYPKGLLASADSGKPVLCVACHASNAYFDKENKKTVMGGMPGIPAFTQALHLNHASVLDPTTHVKLDDINNRSACYDCHPGSKTQCLRGVMGKAVDAKGDSLMSCQSCHGNMTAVGSPARQGWYNEPTCESCHNSAAPGRRAISGVNAKGIAIVPKDHTFATNADTPVPGLNLYRFSKGHGGLQCEACHGSTHAEYPSLHADDNLQSIAVQGHAGPVAECTACHQNVPLTVNGGPHGMHTTGDVWVKQHEDADKSGCSYCHGTTAEGTPLSAIKMAKTIDADEFGIKKWPAGYQVSCYSCHNGPNPD